MCRLENDPELFYGNNLKFIFVFDWQNIDVNYFFFSLLTRIEWIAIK